jgi:hypothetical protein
VPLESWEVRKSRFCQPGADGGGFFVVRGKHVTLLKDMKTHTSLKTGQKGTKRWNSGDIHDK